MRLGLGIGTWLGPAIVLGLLLLCGCTPRDGGPPAPTGSAALTPPAAVDPLLLAQLQRELAHQLAQRGTPRQASQVATTAENRVTTLAQERNGAQVTLSWVEKAAGDYSWDGQVNAADLVPIAQYWQHTSTDSNWTDARRADGDGNGAINISDVAPIGRNFGNELVSYGVYTGATAEFGACNWIVDAGRAMAAVVDGERRYAITFNSTDVSLCFFVAPKDGAGYGIESLPSGIWGTPGWTHMADFSPLDRGDEIAWDPVRKVFYVSGLIQNIDGSTDFGLAKYDLEGQLLWVRACGTGEGELVAGLAVGPDGSVYQSGNSWGLEAGHSVALTVKWSPAGELLWGRSWDDPSSARLNQPSGVAAGSDGLVFINSTNYSASEELMAVWAYTAAGALLFSTTFATAGSDWSGPIAADAQFVYCAGNTNRGALAGNWNTVLICYNHAGARQWGMIYDAAIDCICNDIATTGTNLYIAGFVNPPGESEIDAWLMGLDLTGTLQWNVASGGAGEDRLEGVSADDAGNVYAAGYSDSLAPGKYSGFIQKHQADGAYAWAQFWLGDTPCFFEDLCLDSNNSLVACGYTNSLQHDWSVVGMPTAWPTLTPVPVGSTETPLAAEHVDVTAQLQTVPLTGTVDADTPVGDTNFVIANYNPH